MSGIRRALLELWAVLVMAGVIAFLGPFGTYTMAPWLDRFWHWWALMTGAWATMRPIMLLLAHAARRTALPRAAVVFWGIVLASLPLAQLWRWSSPEQARLLGGYGGLLSATLLCAAAVGAVAWWARRAEAYLLAHTLPSPRGPSPARSEPATPPPAASVVHPGPPRLHARLGPRFAGPILALQSEDHYVRVHGPDHSELVLMRLRDAILEMDGVAGVQTHRSWWVARDHIRETVTAGAGAHLVLANGLVVPIARGAAERLAVPASAA